MLLIIMLVLGYVIMLILHHYLNKVTLQGTLAFIKMLIPGL